MYFTNNSFGKTWFFVQILVSKLLHQFPTFYANIPQSWKINFPPIFYTPSCIGSQFLWFEIILQLITILFTLESFQATILLTLSISYLHLRENLKTGITAKDSFNSLIIYIINLYKFYTQFPKGGNKY